MKYVVTSTLLYGRLQTIDRVISPKNSIPVLSCFLFKFQGEQLEVTASDNETTLKCNIPLIQTEGDCTFAIAAKQLLDILKEIPEQPLTIDFNATTMQLGLTYQNGHFTLQAESGDEYPQMKSSEGESNEVEVPAKTLSHAFAAAIIAASNDEARKIMNGLFIDITTDDLSVVASDGHKLVCYRIFCNTHQTTQSFILPRKPAALLRTIIDKIDGNITLRTFGDGGALVQAEDFQMTCRLLQEKYPNYKNVIPQNNSNIATIDRASLQSAARRVLVASDKATALIKFNFEAGKVTLATENVSYAQSAEEKLVCQYEGIPLRIGFRGDYLLELLSNVQSQDVVLRLSDPARAGLILPSEQEKDTDLTMLLMPLLIAN
ncbi:MAG: DNA polymerase III subunit beta [Bacteroidaceae bacterium]|nr:DNA polymerase III subunit beta [Bacteroidaceae bacterium]